MTTSGLVVVLDGSSDEAEDAVRRIAAEPHFTEGRIHEGPRRAFVLEAEGPRESRDLVLWAESLPGVRLVQVVFVDFATHPNEPPERRTA